MAKQTFTKKAFFAALTFLGVSLGTASAQSSCSGIEWRRMEANFARTAGTEVSSVVAMRSNSDTNLTHCSKYRDGYIVRGRYSFRGGLNDEYFWIEGKACIKNSGASCGFEVTDLNGALMADIAAKGFLAALVGAMASEY